MDLKTLGSIGPSGDVHLDVTRDLGDLRGRGVARRPGVAWQLRNWLRYRRREVPERALLLVGRLVQAVAFESVLRGAVYRPDVSRLAPEQLLKLQQLLRDNFPVHELPRYFGGDVTLYGVLSRRKITTAGVNYLVDAFQNLTEVENFKFHAFGTGTTAESNTDTALQTELTTQYNPDSTRPTGSQTEGGTANVYRSVGTLSPDSGGTLAITEHGLMSQAATGGGTLWDRSVFSAVNLVAGSDSLQVTHDTTCSPEA